MEEHVFSSIAKNLAQVNSSQVDVHTFAKSIVDRVHSEVDAVMTMRETRVQDAILPAMEELVNPRVELAMKSVNASPEREIDSVVPDPNQKYFLGKIESFRMIASITIISNTDLNKIDENCGNITAEGGDLSVNGTKFDRQTDSRHNNFQTQFV